MVLRAAADTVREAFSSTSLALGFESENGVSVHQLH